MAYSRDDAPDSNSLVLLLADETYLEHNLRRGGATSWCRSGFYHRTDGPAIVWPEYTLFYFNGYTFVPGQAGRKPPDGVTWDWVDRS